MHQIEFDDEFHRKDDRAKDTKRQQALELFRERPWQLKVLDEMRAAERKEKNGEGKVAG